MAQATNEQVKKPAEDREDRNEKFEKEGMELVDELNQTCKEIKVSHDYPYIVDVYTTDAGKTWGYRKEMHPFVRRKE